MLNKFCIVHLYNQNNAVAFHYKMLQSLSLQYTSHPLYSYTLRQFLSLKKILSKTVQLFLDVFKC